MSARIVVTRACSVNTEYDYALLMPFLRLLHSSWNYQATREATQCRMSTEKQAKDHTVTAFNHRILKDTLDRLMKEVGTAATGTKLL